MPLTACEELEGQFDKGAEVTGKHKNIDLSKPFYFRDFLERLNIM